MNIAIFKNVILTSASSFRDNQKHVIRITKSNLKKGRIESGVEQNKNVDYTFIKQDYLCDIYQREHKEFFCLID